MSAHPTFTEIRERRLATLRAEAIAAARGGGTRRAGDRLRPRRDRRSHEGSDLDLALDGPEEARLVADTRAWRPALDQGFGSDAVLTAYASPSLLAMIRRDGRDPADPA